MEIQRQIRENAEEVRQYVKSIEDWEEEMKIKEKTNTTTVTTRQLPPIRNSNSNNNNNNNNSINNKSKILVEDKKADIDNVSAAIKEKDKGNEEFGAGKYSLAVASYSRAITLDPSNPVLPANRAMANLKLSNFKEVEIDCTTSIALDPHYVKAYQRRGVARQALKLYEDAIKDFQQVLKLETGNKQATEELQKILNLKSQQKLYSEPPAVIASVAQPSPIKSSEPTRKRIPIKVVDESESAPTTPVKGPTKSDITRDISPQKSPLHSNVQGNLNSTKQHPDTTKNVQHPKPNITISLPTSPPKTAFEFERMWHSLSSSTDLRAQYIKLSDPNNFPTLFKESMSSEIFFGVINTISQYFIPERDFKTSLSILDNIRKVGRFDMISMFMSDEEKNGV